MSNVTRNLASSRWIRALEKQRLRRKHIVLYGNIHDQCLWEDRYFPSVPVFLDTYFNSEGYDIVLRYDPIDGMEFAHHEMRAAFERLRRQTPASQAHETIERSAPQAANPVRQAPSQAASSAGPVTRRKSPEDAFAELRIVLRQRLSSVVGIINLGDMLTSDAARYDPSERDALMLLKKCTLEAGVIESSNLQGYKNMLVILAGDLKRVPEWFYMNDPHVELVQVERPDREERRYYAIQRIRPRENFAGFLGGDAVSDARADPRVPSELELLAEEFADLTEGLQTVNLEAMRFASHQAQIPLKLKQVRRLVDFFKFDQRDDPWESLDSSRVETAKAELEKEVIGQPKAVETVVNMLVRARVGINLNGGSYSGAPKGVFFFVGPTGVGKTELAKSVTRLVFGDERAFARFDMSEYKEEHAAEKLAGAPPGFVGYDQGGLLTNRVIQQPYSILLFDEIEKAHPKVLDKFLQILEDGRLTDGKGQTAYFNQTVIIFTSNLGASDLTDPDGNIIREGIMRAALTNGVDQLTREHVEQHFQEEVRWYFTSRLGRAELLNRLGDSIVVFDLLRPDYIAGIAQKFVRLLAESVYEKYRCRIDVTSSWFQYLDQTMRQPENLLYGGRRIKTLTATYLLDPLSAWFFTRIANAADYRDHSLQLSVSSNGKLVVTAA